MTTWAFPPQVNVTERQLWTTDVIRCKGAEQRMTLQPFSRTNIRYEHFLYPSDHEAAIYIARNFATTKIDLPFWQDLEYVGVVTLGQTAIPLDTMNVRYVDGSKAFIIDNDNSWEVVDVISHTPTAITVSATTKAYNTASVMPCHPAMIESPLQVSKSASDITRCSISFLSDFSFGIVGKDALPIYKSNSVLDERPLVSGTANWNYQRERANFNSVAGPLYTKETYTYPISTQMFNWRIQDRTALYEFREWMEQVKGKLGAFYVPDWGREFIPTRKIEDTFAYFYVQTNNWYQNYYTGPIVIVAKDGRQIYATVTSIVNDSPTEDIVNLEVPVGDDVELGDTDMVSRMPLMRFDSDVIEYSFNSASEVNISLPLFEVPA